MNEMWECYLCSKEFSFEKSVSAFIANYHPVCKKCSDKCVLGNNIHIKRLTYHYKYGEIKTYNGIPVENNRYNQN